jgi:hypothetical protein
MRGLSAGRETEIQCVTTVGAEKKDRDSFAYWYRVAMQNQNDEHGKAAELVVDAIADDSINIINNLVIFKQQ